MSVGDKIGVLTYIFYRNAGLDNREYTAVKFSELRSAFPGIGVEMLRRIIREWCDNGMIMYAKYISCDDGIVHSGYMPTGRGYASTLYRGIDEEVNRMAMAQFRMETKIDR